MIDHLINEANMMRRMGRLLKREHLVPDIIISSTAIRASATAEAVAKASGYKGEIIMNESLYAAGPEAYLDVMHDLIHNPGLVPTCSLAHINLRVDKWLETDYEIRGQLEEMWLPRDLT